LLVNRVNDDKKRTTNRSHLAPAFERCRYGGTACKKIGHLAPIGEVNEKRDA
jgi:hypothetical protein